MIFFEYIALLISLDSTSYTIIGVYSNRLFNVKSIIQKVRCWSNKNGESQPRVKYVREPDIWFPKQIQMATIQMTVIRISSL